MDSVCTMLQRGCFPQSLKGGIKHLPFSCSLKVPLFFDNKIFLLAFPWDWSGLIGQLAPPPASKCAVFGFAVVLQVGDYSYTEGALKIVSSFCFVSVQLTRLCLPDLRCLQCYLRVSSYSSLFEMIKGKHTQISKFHFIVQMSAREPKYRLFKFPQQSL